MVRLGTFGQKATESLLRQKSAQYPSYYKATDFVKQYGQKVHDCSGLIKGYLFCDDSVSFATKYDLAIDGGIKYEKCTEKGTLETMPDIAGTLVFMPGHVGVYIGNGKVIEARGHAYGVVETNLAGRGWTHWGKCQFIEYVDDINVAHNEDEAKKIIQEKCGFDDNTMFWLSRYIYHEALFIKWANSYLK